MNPDQYEEWLMKDKEACAQITLTLKDEPLSSVLYASTAVETWTKLSERYEGKGKQSIAYLIGELFHGTLTNDQPMETQLNAMWQKAHILLSLGQPLNDSLVAITMVISLLQSYSTLWTILMSSNDKLTIETVISQVLTNPGKKSKATDRKKKKKCIYAPCGKTGHMEDECYKKKADKAAKAAPQGSAQGSKDKSKEKMELTAKVATVAEEDCGPLCLFMACTCPETSASDKLSPSQPVIVGDGRTIQAIGKGRIEVSMHLEDGRTSGTILRDIYYVPDLDTNLVSVPALASKGLLVTFGEQECRVHIDSKVVALATK
ncbi:hypothetical protein M404DRAFT_30610 [Pisolithus tinctorius Marx 270]|uniref:Retrovirus-related Pol polyprotein from transposon TNT 1-94-like beta-barrel domain-containing protein n=1 Tax=Pisolithus tinctorius Marx 270 TaxID=870435 RepID=A0A0C3IQB7_PISTI|nr:hypothetical protein M404DRAFT_30610 [Pisolithus tinctorius Marx 270]